MGPGQPPVTAGPSSPSRRPGLLDLPVGWKVYAAIDGWNRGDKEATREVRQGGKYRCPVEGCGCEITVTSDPQMEATQSFVDCCGHDMEKVS